MKLRIAQLVAEQGLNAHSLAVASKGRIGKSTAYRLLDGSKETLRLEEIAALCDVLGVEPGALFDYRRGKRG